MSLRRVLFDGSFLMPIAFTLRGHSDLVRCLEATPGLTRLVSGDFGGFIKVWDVWEVIQRWKKKFRLKEVGRGGEDAKEKVSLYCTVRPALRLLPIEMLSQTLT